MTRVATLPRKTDFFIPEADVVRRAGRLGAEIRNVRLSGDLPQAAIEAIHRLLLSHKVIFFRGQDRLDDDGQLALAAKLGTPTSAHPTVTSRGAQLLPILSLIHI